MYFTGFADEASSGIAGQIAATKELGWNYIESRAVNGTNLHNLSDEEFDKVCEALSAAGIKVNCFGSTIANWSFDPFKEEDFQTNLVNLDRAIKRMHVLGTKMIRGMSFFWQQERPPFDPEVEAQVFKKVNDLVKRCEDGGVIYLHENCMNYGGQSYKNTLKLLDHVKSPNFKLVFDTGNPVTAPCRIGDAPYKRQDSFEFYKNVREFIHYIHIKDFQPKDLVNFSSEGTFCYPGEGLAQIPEIMYDLFKHGYDGGISIEPHMATVYHDADSQKNMDNEKAAKIYIEYGRRMMKIVEDAKAKIARGE